MTEVIASAGISSSESSPTVLHPNNKSNTMATEFMIINGNVAPQNIRLLGIEKYGGCHGLNGERNGKWEIPGLKVLPFSYKMSKFQGSNVQ